MDNSKEQLAFAAATGAPSPEQWAANKQAEREAARAKYAKRELPPAVVEALDIWRDARGDIALAVECALCTWGHDDEMYRDVCVELQSIADRAEGDPDFGGSW